MIIRRTPEDFRVTEHLTVEANSRIAPAPQAMLREPGPWAIWKLTKTSLTTVDAIGWLAKSLGIKAGQVEYAGMKDKHAVTTQVVSVPFMAASAAKAPKVKVTADVEGDTVTNPPLPPTLPPPTASLVQSPPLGTKHEGRGWSAELIGFAAEPLMAAAIERNHFDIVVREMTQRDVREMGRRASILKSETGLLVPNYFGDQRFSGTRNPASFAAVHIIDNDFESALKLLIATPSRKDHGQKKDFTRLAATHWGDWKRLTKALPRCQEYGAIEKLSAGGTFAQAFSELPYIDQQMTIESFQSYLWNLTLRNLCEMTSRSAKARSFSTPDPFGELVFPAPELLSPELRSLEIPLLASTTQLRDPWKQFAIIALKSVGVHLSQLRVPELRRPQFGEAMRPAFILARDFKASPAECDDLGREGRLKRTVSFDLQRGGYATVVLRALGQ